MDTVAKVIIFALVLLFPKLALANYPAGIKKDSYCWVSGTSIGSYRCSSPMFSSAMAAAEYGCQQRGPAFVVTSLTHLPIPAEPIGLNAWGTYSWQGSCASGGSTSTLPSHSVQAVPECGTGGQVIFNYAPATCSGNPPVTPPMTCGNTNGLTISAFHEAPVAATGCYATCRYLPSIVESTIYNGVEYFAGTWVGKGEVCGGDDVALSGGVPGNAQNVGGGGGLSANDLLGLAREATLQELLANAQQTANYTNQNSGLLQAIRDNTKAIAEKPDSQSDMSDPENFEQTYRDAVASTPDVPGGALSGLPTETIDVSGTFQNQQGFLNVAGCPAGPSFTVQGKSYQFDLSPLCQFAQGLSYIVVALAALTGVKIFVGGFK